MSTHAADVIIVGEIRDRETAGGLMSPLNDEETNLDLINVV